MDTAAAAAALVGTETAAGSTIDGEALHGKTMFNA
jgi:hypothetical protein